MATPVQHLLGQTGHDNHTTPPTLSNDYVPERETWRCVFSPLALMFPFRRNFSKTKVYFRRVRLRGMVVCLHNTRQPRGIFPLLTYAGHQLRHLLYCHLFHQLSQFSRGKFSTKCDCEVPLVSVNTTDSLSKSWLRGTSVLPKVPLSRGFDSRVCRRLQGLAGLECGGRLGGLEGSCNWIIKAS